MTKRSSFLSPIQVVFICLFLDFLGIGLTVPTLTPLLKDPDANLFRHETSQQFRDTIYLVLSSLFFMGTLFGAPVIGLLSDRYGRRKMILFTASSTVISTTTVMIGIFLKVVSLLFIGRIIAGLFSGMLIILQSTIADVSEPEKKARNFGLVGIAFGVGFSFGPIMGSVLMDSHVNPHFGYYLPYLLATVINGLNLFFIWMLYPETHITSEKKEINYFKGLENLRFALSNKALRNIFLIIVILATGFSLFIQFFQAYLINQFGFTKLQQGIALLYVGVWIAISQGLILRLMLKKFRPWQILRFSIPLMGLAFILLEFANGWLAFFCIAPLLAISQGLTFPSTLSIISNKVSGEVQGEVIGINQSVQAFASSMPLLLGVLAARFNSFTLIFGACCALLAWFIYFRNIEQYKAIAPVPPAEAD